MTIAELLFSSKCFVDGNGLCLDAECEHAVAEFEDTGRWFILFGHAGFNSKANNGMGYGSKAKALASMRRYLKK